MGTTGASQVPQKKKNSRRRTGTWAGRKRTRYPGPKTNMRK